MRKDLSFEVSEGLTLLSLEDLWAKVLVRTGPPETATVVLEGDEKLVNQVKVEHPNPTELILKGEQGGNTAIMGRSSVVVRGRGSVVVGGNIRGSVISSGDLVIINGRVVSGGKNVTVIEGDEMLKIQITVPERTDLSSYGVEELDSRGLGGKLTLSLSGQQQAVAEFVRRIRVSCSGQSEVRVTKASGELNVSASGQSSVSISGDFEDVETQSSGQSHIGINGNCRNFEGNSSGQSSVSVSGSVFGRVRKHSSGQSNIRA